MCNDAYYNSSVNYCGIDLNANLQISNPSYPCLSDYGNPLMYYNNGKWYLYGVLTKLNIDPNNNQCLQTPYYFAQVSSVIYWIYENIIFL